MADVVLNDSVYIRALLADSTGDPSDLRDAATVRSVFATHRLVWSGVILDRYMRHHSRFGRSGRGLTASAIMRQLTLVLADSQRSYQVIDAPACPGDYDPDDRPMVEAAAAVHGVLVTNDLPLIEALNRAGLPSRHDFEVIDGAVAATLL